MLEDGSVKVYLWIRPRSVSSRDKSSCAAVGNTIGSAADAKIVAWSEMNSMIGMGAHAARAARHGTIGLIASAAHAVRIAMSGADARVSIAKVSDMIGIDAGVEPAELPATNGIEF